MTLLKHTVSINETTPSQYKDFSCGEAALDEYLKRFAKNHEKINIGRTFVLLKDQSSDVAPKVIGFYTLCSAQISIEDLPPQNREKLPKFPVPASRLCRLAVDQTFKGQKLGRYLLADAIKRVLIADATMAVHALIVDAKHEEAKNFYSHFGFLPFTGNQLKLFLPISTLKKSTQ